MEQEDCLVLRSQKEDIRFILQASLYFTYFEPDQPSDPPLSAIQFMEHVKKGRILPKWTKWKWDELKIWLNEKNLSFIIRAYPFLLLNSKKNLERFTFNSIRDSLSGVTLGTLSKCDKPLEQFSKIHV